jgi:hypothetical protein
MSVGTATARDTPSDPTPRHAAEYRCASVRVLRALGARVRDMYVLSA